jgi:hypothetical protein
MKTPTPRGLIDTLDIVSAAPEVPLSSVDASRIGEVRRLQALARHRGVVGLGISEKVSDGQTTGELSLCFYVRHKRTRRQVRGDEVIPPFVCTQGHRAWVTDVKEIGDCRPHATAAGVLRSGGSVSHAASDAGTIGAIVTRAGRRFILSNSHVLARSGKGRIGDPVVAPGRTDGGQLPADLVARLAAFVPFQREGDNRVDAAIAEVAPGAVPAIDLAIPGVVAPPRVQAAGRGMAVAKTGRTTQHTTSHVIDAHFRTTLRYPGVGLLRFADQILCEAFADPGDSGALVTAVDTGRVVGLHFAGSGTVSICNPIAAVLAELGVALAP